MFANALIGDGKQGIERRGNHTQDDTQTVTRIELENQIDAEYGEQTEQCLLMMGSSKAVKNPTKEKHTTPMLTLEALIEA